MRDVCVILVCVVWLLVCCFVFSTNNANILWLRRKKLPLAVGVGVVGGILTQIVGWPGWVLLFMGGVLSADLVDIPGRDSSPLEKSVTTRLFVLSIILALAVCARFLVFFQYEGLPWG